MSCEKYKAALIGAAAIGEDAASDDASLAVRSHSESCRSCAAELAEQRSLLAAIDTSLARTMNAPVPAAMLQRIEARIAQQKPSRSLNLSWLYAAAALATTAALLLFALSHQHMHKSNSQFTTLAKTAKSSSDHRPETMTAILQPASPQEIRTDRMQHVRTAARARPEVLVPPDQELLLAAYAQKLRDQKPVLQASLGGLSPIEPSTIAATEIRNLEIKPLPDLNAK